MFVKPAPNTRFINCTLLTRSLHLIRRRSEIFKRRTSSTRKLYISQSKCAHCDTIYTTHQRQRNIKSMPQMFQSSACSSSLEYARAHLQYHATVLCHTINPPATQRRFGNTSISFSEQRWTGRNELVACIRGFF